jgi:hypothetical protein
MIVVVKSCCRWKETAWQHQAALFVDDWASSCTVLFRVLGPWDAVTVTAFSSFCVLSFEPKKSTNSTVRPLSSLDGSHPPRTVRLNEPRACGEGHTRRDQD